ncbi:MAG: ATP-binding protein [Myxococcota bacterium]|nr:ATP-binding protein [Myxococcota bacterium]
MSTERCLSIRSEMDASVAVLEATAYCEAAGFAATPSRMIATAVSELARNILKYAGTGEVRLRRIEGPEGRGVEIEATDRGPGIADPEAAMRDHFSSGGTLGLGLPGVERMMDEFTLDSAPGRGTRVKARKWI